jgi:phosphoglycolate phosphatase-like HAD superfamily hydrolase
MFGRLALHTWTLDTTPLADAIAAAKAGIRTMGVTCGGWSAAALEEAGCVAVYADPADLLANIDRWAR